MRQRPVKIGAARRDSLIAASSAQPMAASQIGRMLPIERGVPSRSNSRNSRVARSVRPRSRSAWARALTTSARARRRLLEGRASDTCDETESRPTADTRRYATARPSRLGWQWQSYLAPPPPPASSAAGPQE